MSAVSMLVKLTPMQTDELQILDELKKKATGAYSDQLPVLAEDGDALFYWPRLRQLTGSVTAAIFLSQVVFLRYKMRGPFIKFREPPKKWHPAYTQGDSWVEELGFGPRELRSAIMATSGIVSPGQPRPDTFLWRWTTREHLTFWDVNVAALTKALRATNNQYGHENNKPRAAGDGKKARTGM